MQFRAIELFSGIYLTLCVSFACSPSFVTLAGKGSVLKALSSTIVQAAFAVTSELETVVRAKRSEDAFCFPAPPPPCWIRRMRGEEKRCLLAFVFVVFDIGVVIIRILSFESWNLSATCQFCFHYISYVSIKTEYSVLQLFCLQSKLLKTLIKGDYVFPKTKTILYFP